jgi:hypothetical protein
MSSSNTMNANTNANANAAAEFICNNDSASANANTNSQSQELSICIPRIFANITEERIRDVIDGMKLGLISRIDVIQPYSAASKENYKRAFVHFTMWYLTDEAQDARGKLLRGEELKVSYDGKWFWKLSANRASTQVVKKNNLRKDAIVRSALQQINVNTPIIEREAQEEPQRPVKNNRETNNLRDDDDNEDNVIFKRNNVPMPELFYGNTSAPKKTNRKLVGEFNAVASKKTANPIASGLTSASIAGLTKNVLIIIDEPVKKVNEMQELKEEVQKIANEMQELNEAMQRLFKNFLTKEDKE